MILDLEMPEMNGMAVLTEIRRRNSALPVIMLTAYGTTANAQAARQCGANDFLAKSGAMSELILMIQEVLLHKAG